MPGSTGHCPGSSVFKGCDGITLLKEHKRSSALLAGQEHPLPLFSLGRRDAKEGQFGPLLEEAWREAWLHVPVSGEGLG